MRVELTKEFTFEAAHRLPHLPPEHKCARLHGHSYRVEIAVEGPVDPHLGWYIDYAVLQKAMDPLLEQLDHRYLNEVEGLSNPTAEILTRWLWVRLKGPLPGLSAVTVHETCTSRCTYRGE